MASVEWTEQGLDSLARHDAWRVSQGWGPLGLELFDSVEAYFRRHHPERPPRFMPGRPVGLEGEELSLRMVTVKVRSKLFRVFFRYDEQRQIFTILRILHPRAR